MQSKHLLSVLFGVIGGFVSYFFGGFSIAIETLMVLMVIDYLTGVLAGAYLKELSSEIGFKGLLKKVMMLIICAVAFRIDILLGANRALFTSVIIFYCCNEAISIVENAIRLDLPIPEKLKQAIQILQEDDNDEGKIL